MRVAVFLKTATKKTANGDRHAMLKVIQHGRLPNIDQVAQRGWGW
jgi:hypothetical protein